MPWALFNRPSIQLGTLKAYLERRGNKLEVQTSHPYLEVAYLLGPELYHWISRNPWVSEALYAPQVFPQMAGAAEGLAKKYVRRAGQKITHSFHYKSLVGNLENQLLKWVESCDWTQYKIIGFSVCFHQLFASLAAAREIKKKYPRATIVLGGSSCGADAGKSLLAVFPFIDYAIEGEGERALMALCDHIAGNRLPTLPENIITRATPKKDAKQRKRRMAYTQLPTLADLPVPDYGDYFAEQRKWFRGSPFIPVIPIEFSRGCWWNKCSFCNLNLQWCGFRYKKAAHMLNEVKTLAARHKCLDFTFVDNMLPMKEALLFFKSTGEHHSDFHFFAEIRSTREEKSSADIFPIYRRGGLTTIQVGIEALSSSLLQKMQKGVRAIENIATMRDAQEQSLELEGNLILQFPGSSETEVAETLESLDYVFPYKPLTGASFFLGHNSPIYKHPREYGIKAIVNHANNQKLFPKPILSELELLVKDYRGDRKYQRKIWKPVLEKIKKWQQYHEKRAQGALSKPLLYYRDGGDFLIIRQELPDGKILQHSLKGSSRLIYLFCRRIRTEKEIFAGFRGIPPQKVLSFLAVLNKKRLLFSEKSRHLALAVHFRN